MTSKVVFATKQLTQAKSAVFVTELWMLWNYCTIMWCVMCTLAIGMATCSYGICFCRRTGSNQS